jgi:hypothetical protein
MSQDKWTSKPILVYSSTEYVASNGKSYHLRTKIFEKEITCFKNANIPGSNHALNHYSLAT